MTAAKVAISIDPRLLRKVDTLVRRKQFRSRSHTIQTAVAEKLGGLAQDDFTRECSKLDPAEEKAWAELGLADDLKSWPAY
jgi:Arc/MetJ-type ribon-helix-helix transcriptional regulator